LALGAALVLTGYGLVYSSRAFVPYEELLRPAWTRYHLPPHLGLALLLPAVLAAGFRQVAPPGGLTARQILAFVVLLVLLGWTQYPRGYASEMRDFVRLQREGLRQLDAVDRLCREA